MVLTRSADKRLDTTRDEDLVLRSRKISSPTSKTSTPTPARKRQVNPRESGGSPRVKRSRFDTDESKGDGDFHVIVNIPVKSVTNEQGRLSQSSDQATNPGADAATSIDTDADTDTTIRDHNDQLTPQRKVIATSETPDPGSEMFKTPATSRRKRFDSDEPEEDTVIVSANIDSSAPQGYQTADEHVSDSDDDDAAPEVETTRARKTLSQLNSTRTPRPRKQKVRSQLASYSEDEETIEVAPVVVDQSPEVAAAQSLPVGASSKHSTGEANEDLDEKLMVDPPGSPNILQPASPEPRASGGVAEQPSAPDNSDSVSPARIKKASLHAVQDLSDPIKSLSIVKSPVEVSDAAYNSALSRKFAQEEMVNAHQTNAAGFVHNFRLPTKSVSTLTGYRRDKLQQREAKSGGGFRMQSNWPKKRNTFISS